MTQVVAWVEAHFQGYRTLSKWQFLWRITVECLLVSTAAALLLKLLSLPPRTDLNNRGFWLAAEGLVIAPFVETIVFQSVPVALARYAGATFWLQVAISAAAFAAAHFLAGIATGIVAGLVGGFYIGFTYVRWREVSFRTALWLTTGAHALHNLVPISIVIWQTK